MGAKIFFREKLLTKDIFPEMAILYYFCSFNEIERSHQLRVIDRRRTLISVRSKKNATLASVAQVYYI